MTMKTTQRDAIARHGHDLLAIFPNAGERDPIALCKKLRRLERQAAAIGLRLCNGPKYPTEDGADKDTDAVLLKVHDLLGNYEPGDALREPVVPIFVNRDPRGYALKIRSEVAVHLSIHRDWGGYGIIAPDFS
jgi:hypothetical protein